jgi:coenzyme F420-reducing hydrogenase delta subunit
MQPRTDGRPLPRQAAVDADLCAACGICAGACPSSTPFRSVADLVSGIDMPQQSVHSMRRELDRVIVALRGETKIVVFGCNSAADVGAVRRSDTAALSLICTAMLPPAFVEYALRNGGVDGVLITGCLDGDCAYRLGNRWTEQRMIAEREPHLRSSVPAERVRIAWHGRFDGEALQVEVDRFRAQVLALSPSTRDVLRPSKRREWFHD